MALRDGKTVAKGWCDLLKATKGKHCQRQHCYKPRLAELFLVSETRFHYHRNNGSDHPHFFKTNTVLILLFKKCLEKTKSSRRICNMDGPFTEKKGGLLLLWIFKLPSSLNSQEAKLLNAVLPLGAHRYTCVISCIYIQTIHTSTYIWACTNSIQWLTDKYLAG